jgi:hypothetical protein
MKSSCSIHDTNLDSGTDRVSSLLKLVFSNTRIEGSMVQIPWADLHVENHC